MFVECVQQKPYAQMMPSRDAAPCTGENATTFAPGGDSDRMSSSQWRLLVTRGETASDAARKQSDCLP
jgi:hypothetical protein